MRNLTLPLHAGAFLISACLSCACSGDSDGASDSAPDAAADTGSDADTGSCAADACSPTTDIGFCANDRDCAPGEICTDATICEPATVPAYNAPEATVLMNYEAAVGGSAFFDAPYPSDVRLDSDGTVRLAGLPNTDPATAVDLFLGLLETAEQLRGFSQIPVIWFRATVETAPFAWPDFMLVQPDSLAATIVNIDISSPGYGEEMPVVMQSLPEDPYVPERVFAVAPRPGVVLRPRTRYAVILNTNLAGEAGESFGADATTWTLIHGGVPEGPFGEALALAHKSLREVLPDIGLTPEQVVATTAFTTGDAPEDLFNLSDRVRENFDATLTNIRVDATDGADHERYCEILADAALPQFQQGTPPFDTEGLFDIGADGVPVEQRQETIPVVFTLPLDAMPPAGFPLIMYFHGSGGTHDQVVARSFVNAEGFGANDEGMAHTLGGRGFAAFGSAHPISPDRVPGASSIAYLNFANLKMFRDLFRQGVIEQRLLLDALLELELDPSVVADCQGLSLPADAETYRFDPDSIMAMGQSMGGQYTNLIGATEPRIRAVVPTGAGGYWSFFIFQATLIDNIPSLLKVLLGTQAELSFVHPVFSVLQQAWEPVEPMVYMPRLGLWPINGHPARPVYEPVAPGDSFFPTMIYDAMAIAYGHQQAGDEVWESMQTALGLVDRDGLVDYPIQDNNISLDGTPYTGAVIQFVPDGYSDPHVIFVQLNEVKHQLGCFFETFNRTGTAVIVAPSSSAEAPCE
jgi:hypothetical protein